MKPIALILLAASPALAADAGNRFEEQIRPLLEERCVECHGEKKQKAELRLDAKVHAFKGGESGAAIIPGDSAKSPLFRRIISDDEDERMPPKGEPLTQDEITLLKTWIDAGAHWPENENDRAASVDKRLEHWSLQPVKPPTFPHPSVDTFIDAKLKEAGLSRSPTADRRTLIRRASFDVIGLPPTPEEVEAFVSDRDPKAYEKLIERLLASPRLGERWARHWLDVVRFAESDGFETNRARENAWPYRDYVIKAFNDDRPFDRFIREQLAGDALSEDAATGFLVGGAVDRVKSKDPVLTANQRADELHDMVSTTAAAFLGLTLNCARCHDHKFDPIPAKDYYAFVAMLEGVKHGQRPMHDANTARNERRAAALRSELAPVEAKLMQFQPRAGLGRVLLLDDSSTPPDSNKPGVTQIEQPANGNPILYSPGREQGQAGDPGDVTRLPNLGESYRYWAAKPGTPDDFFAWEPKLRGRFRIWISWGAWTTHSRDARYVLDRDGDLKSTGDQTDIATANQRQFADGTPAVPEQRRWSGFRAAGVHDLSPTSVIVLRSGESGGPTVADVMAFEEVLGENAAASSPHLRPPVSHRANEEVFDPIDARFLRFTATASSSAEPCIDELEAFDTTGRNVALGNSGAKATASGVYAGGRSPKHTLEHVNDGRYGNDFSWISSEKGAGWVRIEFAKPERLDRVVWSRDRSTGAGRVYDDRLAIQYRIEVSMDATHWQTVASSGDRLGAEYRKRIETIPTIGNVPANQAPPVLKLSRRRSELLDEIQKLSSLRMVYAGTFEQPGPTHRNHRGDPMQPRETIAPGALSQIGKPLALPADTPEQERRLALANWIADPANPLTARVIVNRLWHYHFGTGIVDTPSDFGINGSRPTHPELLDWLANELVTHGWGLKHIHRLILLSQTYQQAGSMNEAAFTKDSSARLLWRFPPRRLEAEVLRDAMLAVAGKLDLRMGGPGFDLFEPNDNYVKVYTTKSEYGPAEFRRMIYQSKPRTMLDDLFGAFDCPDAGQPQPKRTSSTTPLQALNLLNSSFAIQQAGFLAERLKREAGESPAAQVKCAFVLVFGREPSTDEAAAADNLVRQHGLPILCRALLNLNEFISLF